MQFSLKVQHRARDKGQMYRLYRSQLINSSCVLCVPGVPEKGSAYENTHRRTQDSSSPHKQHDRHITITIYLQSLWTNGVTALDT